jgi:SNF2 family DNA or RNA helicase
VIPDYLKEPSLKGHLYGKLVYNEKKNVFRLSGEPLLMQYAKRMFPGARVTRGRGGYLEFHSTRREVSDLNWLLMRFPVDIDQCRQALTDARQSAIDQINRRRSGADRKRATPPSDFLGKLYPYQEMAVSFMTSNERCVLGDGMGLGKTWSGLAAAAYSDDYPVLIVCQTHVQRQWQRMIGMLFDLPGLKGARDMAPFELATKRGQALAPILRTQTASKIPDTPFAITHYGLIAWWQKEILKRRFKTVIFDEVQELRHTGTGKYSAASLFSGSAFNVWGLSGTPVYGYGKEIWSVMNAIDFHCLGSEEAFTREWCAGYGEKIVEDPRALHGHLSREGLLLRRRYTDDEVSIDLPTVLRKVEDLRHDERIYDKLIDAARAKAHGYGRAHYIEKGRLARDIERESRKATGIAKARYVAEFVAGLLDAGERPLVYAWHHDVHDILQDRLRFHKPAIFTGKQNVAQKDAHLKRFMNGETNLGLLSLRSAAGLDGLQHRATMCVFGELDWSPAIHSQCETRIARIGVADELRDVPSYYCVASVGHDEVMLDVLGVKTGQFVGLMGDEPESYEEKQEAEERAARRIDMLVDKLTDESRPSRMKSDGRSKKAKPKSRRRQLLGAFSGKLRDG